MRDLDYIYSPIDVHTIQNHSVTKSYFLQDCNHSVHSYGLQLKVKDVLMFQYACDSNMLILHGHLTLSHLFILATSYSMRGHHVSLGIFPTYILKSQVLSDQASV